MTMDWEQLYSRLPQTLQLASIHIEGLRIRRRRFNTRFHRLLDEYRTREYWPMERMAAWRDARLAAFVIQAAATTPYYRDMFRNQGLHPADICALEHLPRLPVLNKQEVQEQTSRFESEMVNADRLWCHTSGSTGAGLRFPATYESQREHWACWWRYRSWHGIAFDTEGLILTGRNIVPLTQHVPPYWRRNRPMRQTVFSGYHLSPETARLYLRKMRAINAPWLHGYPSMVALLAGYALDLAERLTFKWITLGAENVSEQQIAVIESAFGVRPRAHYSLAEGVANISECPSGAMHVDEDFAAVEFVPLDGPVCRIVGVNVSNPAFPLIRYDTGDLAVVSDAACACGRPGRIVRHIDGRQEDIVISKGGARLGRLDHIFKDMVHVRAAQIYQSRPGHMELHIVRGTHYKQDDETRLRREIEKRVGNDMEYRIHYVDDIPRTAAGKIRFVISDVPKQTHDA